MSFFKIFKFFTIFLTIIIMVGLTACGDPATPGTFEGIGETSPPMTELEKWQHSTDLTPAQRVAAEKASGLRPYPTSAPSVLPKVSAQYVRPPNIAELLRTHPGVSENNTEETAENIIWFRYGATENTNVPLALKLLGLQIAIEFDDRYIPEHSHRDQLGDIYGMCPKPGNSRECTEDEMYWIMISGVNDHKPFLSEKMNLAYIQVPGKPAITTIVINTPDDSILPLYAVDSKKSDLPFVFKWHDDKGSNDAGGEYQFDINGTVYPAERSPCIKGPNGEEKRGCWHSGPKPGPNRTWEIFTVMKRYFEKVTNVPIPHPALIQEQDQDCGNNQILPDILINIRYARYALNEAVKKRPLNTQTDITGRYYNFENYTQQGEQKKAAVSSVSIRRSCTIPGAWEYTNTIEPYNFKEDGSGLGLGVIPQDTGIPQNLWSFLEGSRVSPPDPRFGREKVSDEIDEEQFASAYRNNNLFSEYRDFVKKIGDYAPKKKK